ncbi:MAG: hypothetical protein WCS27_03825 [Victivallaceae bacterium]
MFSFEVPERIEWVIEKGTEIGKNVNRGEGTVIARIDPARYELKLKSIKAKIKSAEAKAEALKVSIYEVMVRQLEAANANLENTAQNYQRHKILLKRNAVSRQSYDNVEKDYKVAQAVKAEMIASVLTKKAEYKALLAQVEELRQNEFDAELDVKNCTLRTRYKGKIADVYANVGANVQSGAKVVKAVVMNPMLISLEVSPNIDRMLRFRDRVRVFPSGMDKSVPGIVTMKSTVADPQTHTFNLELFVQNPKVSVTENLGDLEKLPKINGVVNSVSNLLYNKYRNRLWVTSDAVYKDSGGEFVWKATKKPGSRYGADVYKLKKQYVKFDPETLDFFGIYYYRFFEKGVQNINPDDLLALGVPSNVKDGEKVVQIARRWLFRPGNLVKVLLTDKNTPSGIYIPIESIFNKNGESFVYLLKKVPQQHFCRLAEIKVKLLNQLGAFQRISSPELKSGDEIVFSGVHYVNPGNKIIVRDVKEIDL